jgi:hypothetical protein
VPRIERDVNSLCVNEVRAVERDLSSEMPGAISALGLIQASQSSHLVRLVSAGGDAASVAEMYRRRKKKHGAVAGRPEDAGWSAFAGVGSLDRGAHDTSTERISVDTVERRR